MRTVMTALTLAVILIGAASEAADAQTPAELFASAQLLEVNEGDLDGALALYRRIVADAEAPAALKAQALYREGLCLVKKDDCAGARTVFERLIAEHSRTDPAVQAKLMLRSLGAAEKGMAPAKDLTAVVRELLVAGATDSKQARSALTSLAFYGSAAKPVLHAALDQPDRGIQVLALNALAQIGDPDVLSALLEAAGTPEFRRRTSSVPYSPETALKTLCKSQETALSRVAAACSDLAPGLARANLIRVLADLEHLDRTGDWKAFLTSEDAEMRQAAWEAYSGEVGRGRADASPFLDDLLGVWEAHPAWHVELSEHLFRTGGRAARKDPALSERWNAALLAAARSEDPDIVKRVVQGLRHPDLGAQFEVREVLLRSADPEVREQAATLYFMYVQPRPEVEVDQNQLERFVNALLEAVVTHVARDAAHAGKLLGLLDRPAWLLEPARYAALVDRLFSEPLRSRLVTESRIGRSDATTNALIQVVAISDVTGASRQADRKWTIAEKYLPVLLRYAGPEAPANLRRAVLYSLGAVVERSWKFLSDADRLRIKEVLVAGNEEVFSDRLPAEVAEELRRGFDEALVLLAQQRPRLLTVEDVLTRLSFDPRVSGASPLSRILDCFSRGELRNGFQNVAGRHEVPVHVVTELIQKVGTAMPAEERDAAFRALWPRASEEARCDIVDRLAQTPDNLKFLTDVITQDLTDRLALGIADRLRGWSDREVVPGLVKLLDVGGRDTKLTACSALGSLADPRGIEKLIELLAYPDSTVRAKAEEALTAIRNIDRKQAEWQEWYEQLRKDAGSKP
ncbi:MAG: HEAT repeat domain-containing protein [Planctomycetes bacterium]|nr:HEAT repeat domain-containing protein [Planctomycetota bacterium]